MFRMRKRSGFTLIELALGGAMVAVGAAIVLPALRGQRDDARRRQCHNHLHQLALALHNYADTNKCFPPGWTSNKFGWQARILPYLDRTDVYDKLNFQAPFDPQDKLLQTRLDVFRCPQDRGGDLAGGLGRANYAGVMVGTPSKTKGESTHGGGSFGLNSRIRFRDYTDGTSMTLMVGERMSTARQAHGEEAKEQAQPKTIGTEGTWVGLNPGEISIVSSADLGVPNSAEYGAFSSVHRGGTHFLKVDGSVQFINHGIDAKTFSAYCTIGGAETVNQF